MENLVGFVNHQRIAVALIQDFYLKDDRVWSVPTNWSVYKSKNNTAAILISRTDIISNQVHKGDNSIYVNIMTNTGTLTIGSIYSKPHAPLQEDLTWIFNHPNLENLIVGADLNVRLSLLGYRTENEKGRVFSFLLQSRNLTLLNDPEAPPTFIGQPSDNRSGTPDVTFCTSDLLDNIISWKVEDLVETASDHRYISFSLTTNPVQLKNYRYKTKFNNFKIFNYLFKLESTRLISQLLEIKNKKEFKLWLEQFLESLQKICQTTFKNKKYRNYPSFTWWTPELKTQRNKIAALNKRFKSSGNIKWKLLRNKEKALYKRNITLSKLKAWQRFCTNTKDRFGHAFKIATGKNLGCQQFYQFALEGQSVFTTQQDIFNVLLDHHFPQNPPLIHDDSFEPITNFPKVTKFEILESLKLQGNTKAPGPDNFDALILKNAVKTNVNLFIEMYNKCLLFSYFPDQWKVARVIFFNKVNKDPTLPSSYRPICLLSMLGKLLERIIKHRLSYHFETQHFFNIKQYGFREHRSTIDLLTDLTNKIKLNIQQFKYTQLISFDIKGAFDSINWQILIQELKSQNLPLYLTQILMDYLNNRTVITDLYLNTNTRPITQGCPQGSCLGPLLWLVIANVILSRFQSKYNDIWAFADDFTIISSAKNRRLLEEDANSKIQLFSEIVSSLKLKLSEEKTVALLFGRKTLHKRLPLIKLNGKTIKYVNEIKILGVTFNKALTWENHIQNISTKILLLNNTFKKVSSTTWGVSRSLLRTWYLVVIEKIIVYGAEVWYKKLRIMDKRKLNSIQRLSLLSISKSYRSVSTAALQVILGIPPILLTLEKKVHKYNFKKNLEIINDNNTIYTIDKFEVKLPKNTIHPASSVNNLHNITKTLDNNIHLHIYTDGSKTDDNTAYAIVIQSKNKIIETKTERLHHNNTVFQAELQAILISIKWVINSDFNTAQIFSDSQSAISAIYKLYPQYQSIRDTHDLLKLHSRKHIFLTWVKGHSGIEGNVLADSLANTTATYSISTINNTIKFPASFLNKLLKTQLLQNWQYQWSNSLTGRFTHNIIPKVSETFYTTDRVSIYFYSGCGSFPTFLYKIGKIDSDHCQCGHVGTPQHYLFESCKFMKHKFKMDPQLTFQQNLQRIVDSPVLRKRFYENYNILNSKYSYINYKF